MFDRTHRRRGEPHRVRQRKEEAAFLLGDRHLTRVEILEAVVLRYLERQVVEALRAVRHRLALETRDLRAELPAEEVEDGAAPGARAPPPKRSRCRARGAAAVRVHVPVVGSLRMTVIPALRPTRVRRITLGRQRQCLTAMTRAAARGFTAIGIWWLHTIAFSIHVRRHWSRAAAAAVR